MSNNHKSILFLELFLLCSTISKGQDYSFKPEYSTTLDSSKGRDLMHQCTRCMPENVDGFWNLTLFDVENIETNFRKLLAIKSICGVSSPNDSVSQIKEYAFQFIGISIGGKKYIYVNAFKSRDTQNRWRSEPVNVCDGGKGFWGVLFDPESTNFSQLAFNDEG